jgi:Fe-S cluster assembly iron-binding protein IscA
MIRVTERAANGLRDLLAASQAEGNQSLKLVLDESGGVAMTIGQELHGDAVVPGEKRPLLIVDAALASRLDDVVLDFTKGNGLPPHFVFLPGEP